MIQQIVFQPQNQKDTRWYCAASGTARRPLRFSTQYNDLEQVHERIIVGFILAKHGPRGLYKNGDEQKLPKNT